MKEANNVKNEAALSLEAKHADLQKQYYAMVDSQAQVAADQAGIVSRLGSMRENHTAIQQSIILLGFTLSILAGVKTTFLNVATFWSILAGECSELIKMKDEIKEDYKNYMASLKDEDDPYQDMYKDTLREVIMNGGQKWAAVGSVCLDAHDGILAAKDTVDGVMCAIPANASKQELQILISGMEPRLALKNMELQKELGNIEKPKGK